MHMRKMPWGMKIIVILSLLDVISMVINFFQYPRTQSFFFGFFIPYPFSIFIKILAIVIVLIIVGGIFKRKGRKLILWFKGFAMINVLVGSAVLWNIPLPELIARSGRIYSLEVITVIQSHYFLFKFIPAMSNVIIGIIIWFYIFKKKDYFSDAKKSVIPPQSQSSPVM